MESKSGVIGTLLASCRAVHDNEVGVMEVVKHLVV